MVAGKKELKLTTPETAKLIELYQAEPSLWNVESTDYHRKDVRHGALTRIVEALQATEGVECSGNAAAEDISTLYNNRLIPTVAGVTFLSLWYDYWKEKHRPNGENSNVIQNGVSNAGPVVIEIDTGLTRYGCLPEYIPDILSYCEEHSIPIHSLMTHFSQSWDDPGFTQKQMDVFMEAVLPYKKKGIRLQVSNSGAIVNKVGVDLNFVRSGGLLVGRTKGRSKLAMEMVQTLGLKPALTWKVKTTLVKQVPPGQSVGYYHTYTCTDCETIATLPVGYADCSHLHNFKDCHIISSQGKSYYQQDWAYRKNNAVYAQGDQLDAYVKLNETGISCPVVGQVSMDAMTVRLPEGAKGDWVFHLVWQEYGGHNNCMSVDTSAMCFPTSTIDRRVPRLYVQNGKINMNGQNGERNMDQQNELLKTDRQNELLKTDRQNELLKTDRQNELLKTDRQNGH